MKNLGYIFIGLAIWILSSCTTNRFHTTRVYEIDFSKFKTYGWLPPVDSLSKDYYNNDIAKANIMSAANKEIEARGLTYSKENPDILFRYIAIVNNKSRLVYSHPTYFGWGGPWWGWYPWAGYAYYGPSVPIGKQRVRYGHIILEAIDRNNKTVIWQARGTSEVDAPEKAINALPNLIHGIMKEYPIKSTK